MNLYVIGPVTGMPDENIAEFERVKTELWKIGASVDIPHEYINERVGWEDAMLVSVHLLTQFHPMLHHEPPAYEPHYDGIAMLDGWEDSKGARIKHDLACARHRVQAVERVAMSNYLEENGYYAYLDAAGKTLRPCPLCDGKAIYRSGIHNGYDFESGTIRCVGCGLKLGVTLYGYGNYDPLHAFDAWNTRAERTCVPLRRNGDRFEHNDEDTSLDAVCSWCRSYLGEARDVFSGRTAFCSTCGARIERGES